MPRHYFFSVTAPERLHTTGPINLLAFLGMAERRITSSKIWKHDNPDSRSLVKLLSVFEV